MLKSILKIAFFVFLTVLYCGCASSTKNNTNQLQGEGLSQKLDRANDAYAEARLDRAESLFLEIIKDNPGLVDAWLKLGNIYTRQNRLKAATRCFEKAIALNVEDGRAWYNLALVKIKEAELILESAERAVPPNSEYQQYIQNLYIRLIKRNGTK